MTPDLPERMRVARLYAWGDVRIEEAPVPRAGPGDLVIRVVACGVCGSDALPWYVERKAPAVLGHEPVGTVVEIGRGVEGFAIGDRVFVHHHAPCGLCTECRRGLWSNCEVWKVNRIEPGGFAEYLRVAPPAVACDVLHVPPEMSPVAATLIEPLACCIRAVRTKASAGPDDAVLIVGLGAMGLLMVQLARVAGAARVCASDPLADRRALGLRFGADNVVDPHVDDVPDAVRAVTAGRGADVVIVTPGDARAIRAGIAAASPGARVVCFTPLGPDAPLVLDQGKLYFREIALLQSYSCGPDEMRSALALLRDGQIDVEPLVTHTAGLDGVDAALRRAAGKAVGIKTVILP